MLYLTAEGLAAVAEFLREHHKRGAGMTRENIFAWVDGILIDAENGGAGMFEIRARLLCSP